MNYSSEKESTKYVVTYESNDFEEVMETALKKFWYYQNSGADKVDIEPYYRKANSFPDRDRDLCRVRVIAHFTKPMIQTVGEFTV